MKNNKIVVNLFGDRIKKTIANLSIVAISLLGLLWSSQQAIAHHPMGGNLPSNFIEGFASGLGHPVIGLDHFAFVIASGLIAAGQTKGMRIPIAFVLTAMLGTGIHLMQVNLPIPEMVIAGSVIAFGAILAIEHNRQDRTQLSLAILVSLAAIAGIFHGYAYGESIVGAQTSPLIAYLIGFTSIQSSIALAGLAVGKAIFKQKGARFDLTMRFLGLAIGAIGVVFFTSALTA
ncbi:MAG: HupE/UreJ family protein [Xenococcaceae cyanobacterium]